jgi:hypothetical protein
MKTYKERTKPACKYKVLVETKCDLCGSTTITGWKRDQFDALEVDVKLKTGSAFPITGRGEEISIDICPDCFTTKLVPWVQSQGGKPTATAWER